MITRLYVDNFGTLANFELKLQRMSLLMGRNGSGKSSVLDVLSVLRAFAGFGSRIGGLVGHESRTRWDARETQTFELGMTGPPGDYTYRLALQHGSGQARVREEVLQCNGRELVRGFLDQEQVYRVRLFRDDGSEGPELLADWGRSAVAALQEKPYNQQLTWFRRQLAGMKLVAINPWSISAVSEDESSSLLESAANFASWYRHLLLDAPSQNNKLVEDLQQALDGYLHHSLAQAGEKARELVFSFQGQADGAPDIAFRWRELSEGQRCLTVLYTLLRFCVDLGEIVVIDEPDNFIALREIQPWLVSLRESVQQRGGQAVLVSHHPEVVNFLAPGCGLLFERVDGGPTAPPRPWQGNGSSELSPAEIMASGWEDG